ncbi:MAG: hypothetical protein JKY48_16905 [Flavobacteriales bacterium]|nr:hypothetical protein [Flavobacteriales bacterium]
MKNLSSLLIIVIISIAIGVVKISDENFGKKGNYGVIDWDNFGYYMYLPAYFIHDDIKIQDPEWVHSAQRKYDLSSSFYQAHYIENGNRVIQYTSGMALLYSPAFVTGHFIAKVTSFPADGFSKPYQFAILIQSLILVFLGLYFLRKLSLSFFNEKLTTVIILIICLGTNYFQISSANTSSPHVYLFCFYACLLYLVYLWHNTPKVKYSFLIGLLSALMILSRANELLFLLIPLLWVGGKFNSLKEKLSFLLKNKVHLLVIALPLFLFGVIQPIYWNYVTGDWLFDSYTNEDFKLLNPYLTEYLFSYKKGWLLYTPIIILGITGLVALFKKKRQIASLLIIFLIVNVWVLSSWDCWWYADSFSQRSIVQAYPIFVLPFGYLLKSKFSSSKLGLSITSFVFLSLIVLNLFQTWQFSNYIIHPSRMTKEYYWNIFGLTDKNEANRKLLDIDRSINYLPETLPNKHKLIYTESFEDQGERELKVDDYSFKEEGNLVLSKISPRSRALKYAFRDISDTTYSYVICRIRFKSEFEAKENPFGIEFNMIDASNGKNYYHSYRGVENISWFEKGSWSSMDLVVIPPFMRNKEDSIQLNLILKGNEPVLIDNMSIEVLDPSIHPKVEQEVYYTDYHTVIKGDWSKPGIMTLGKGYELIDTAHQYSSTLTLPVKKLKERRTVEFDINMNLQHNYSGALVVVSVDNTGGNTFYKSYPLTRVREGWIKQRYTFNLPKDLPNKDLNLKAYLWNRSKEPVLIRDLKVSIY